jgi:hypothetical protein
MLELDANGAAPEHPTSASASTAANSLLTGPITRRPAAGIRRSTTALNSVTEIDRLDDRGVAVQMVAARDVIDFDREGAA